MNIIIDGVDKVGASRGRTAKSAPKELERLALVCIGQSMKSAAVRKGETIYREDSTQIVDENTGEVTIQTGKAMRFNSQKEAQKLYSMIYNLAKRNETLAHCAPHVLKVSDTELYVYLTDKTIAAV